ncbi:MAG: hypothetical protein HC841_00560 [Verrucomicrobiae bacterium]|nr:hypothetical protein [Verrucomicrobiae bacterium]NJO56699.1 hypothetical protein [Rhodospirillales bacterium]
MLSTMEGRLFERLNPRAVERPATIRAMAAALAGQLAAFSRRVQGIIERLAMDGAWMAIGPRSQGNARPPFASTAG